MSVLEQRATSGQPVELRELGDGMLRLSGYASTTGSFYDLGSFRERIAPGAFRAALVSSPDVSLLVGHAGLPYARTGRSGTLTLAEDDIGLKVDALLDGEDPESQALARRVRTGLLGEMSFAFRCLDDVWQGNDRTIRSLDLDGGDVSVVVSPANPETTVAMRARALAARGRFDVSGVPDHTTRARQQLDGLLLKEQS